MSTAIVIDAQLVKTLREKTDAGLMDCKKALAETNGDLVAAVDVLRKKGTIKAGEKSDREAKEGVIAQAILPGAKVGVLVEVNCETDFVAKNDSFKVFTDELAKKIALDPKADLEADRIEAFQKLKENLVIRRSVRIEVTGPGAVAAYIHTGGKVGVLAEVGATKEETSTTEDFKQLVRDITLHIAAASPVSIRREDVSPTLAARERAIYVEQTPKDKPAPVIEKIIEGKMSKFFAGVCLLEQAFVKNPEQTITQLVAEKAKALGDTLEVRRFLRYQVGEEIAG